MKFEKQYFYSQVPEWKDRYIDYTALVGQIRLITKAAINLAKAYARVKAITGTNVEAEIKVDQIGADRVFWRMLDDNVDKVEDFYKTQLNHYTERFHILTLQAIRLGLIDEYKPLTRGLTTRLEREIERLSLPGEIEVATAIRKEELKRPIVSEGSRLLPLSSDSSFDDIVQKIREAAAHEESDDDDRFDAELENQHLIWKKLHSTPEDDHQSVRSDHSGEGFLSSGGPSDTPFASASSRDNTFDYDSDKSEDVVSLELTEEEDEEDLDAPPRRLRRKITPLHLRPLSVKDLPENTGASALAEPLHRTNPVPKLKSNSTSSEHLENDSEIEMKSFSAASEAAGVPFQDDFEFGPVDLPNSTPNDVMSSAASSPFPSTPSSQKRAREYERDKAVVDKQRAVAQLRAAFAEFYRGLTLLTNFARLNVEAVEKILKKHDKNIELGAREKYMTDIIVNFSFYRRRSLRALMRETESVYAACFTEGHRTAAMKRLRVPSNEKKVGMATFRFGLFFGSALTLLAAVLYLVAILDPSQLENMRPALIVFRMLALCTLLVWLWGVDMWVWTKYRVNYVFIFEFNPRQHIRYQHVFEIASVFTFVLSASVFLYMLCAAQDGLLGLSIPGFQWLAKLPYDIIPLTLVGLVLLILVYVQYRSNWWLVRTLARIFAAPFLRVYFRDFFIADQLCSLVRVFQDFEFTLCFFTFGSWTGLQQCPTHSDWKIPLIAAIPVLSRVLQCLRRFYDSRDRSQLLNAAKYGTSLVVVVTGSVRAAFPGTAMLVLWLLSVIASTMYSFVWDVLRDWSLASRKPLKHRFLRTQLLYPTPWYYVAIVSDMILRFAGTLTLTRGAAVGDWHPDVVITLLAVVEIVRRAMWNVLRLENEHLNNCGKFRVLKDMPLPVPVN